MTSSEIVDLLRVRHSDDVFVPECKNGPTQMSDHVRLDAWAMARSWAHPGLSGYEVKVSRSDFRRDDKMRLYLPLCNQLWVVAPKGIVDPAELLDGVGLLCPASTGTKLLTARKAVYREIEPPVDLLIYVLMCRTTVKSESAHSREDRAAMWRARIADKWAFESLGHCVSKKLREETVKRVEEAERRADAAHAKARALENAATILRELGVDPSNEWQVRQSLTAKLRPELEDLRPKLKAALDAIDRVTADSPPVPNSPELAEDAESR